ncbi:MAG: restriction endonuclease subunit S, partial [Parabacteroides sp.]|nr:restriction endonuclease subunit S [Parabacteroides sp.]
ELLSGKRRLSGFAGKWTKIRFGDCCTIFRGGSPRPISDYLSDNPNDVHWIKIGDVSESDKYITSTAEFIYKSGVSRSREVYAGDFILSNSMSFGRPYILQINGCIHDGWLVIQNYQNFFDQQYLYYALSSDDTKAQYFSMAAGSSVQNLNKEKVANLKLYMPSIKEQEAISDILSDMDTEIVELEKKLGKFIQIKRGMMEQLLTGKIRLV